MLVPATDGLGNMLVTWALHSRVAGIDGTLSTRTPTGAGGRITGLVHQGSIWSSRFVAMHVRGDALYLLPQFADASSTTQILARRYAAGR